MFSGASFFWLLASQVLPSTPAHADRRVHSAGWLHRGRLALCTPLHVCRCARANCASLLPVRSFVYTCTYATSSALCVRSHDIISGKATWLLCLLIVGFQLRDHIVVCGSLVNLFFFVQPLRYVPSTVGDGLTRRCCS